MAEPKMINATWLLDTVDWGRARGMSDADLFIKILEMLRTAEGETVEGETVEGA